MIVINFNQVYNTDNLELMKQIESKSIDMIYCDILYNTKSKFKDFKDNLGTPEQAIEWYRPRIIEMKRLLKETGNIVLQCDRNLSHYMKILMDEIYGLNNFVNEIIWKRSSGNSLSTKISTVTDSLLFYRMSDKSTYNQQYHELKDKKWLVEKETGRLFTHSKLDNAANFKYKGEERIVNGITYKTDIGWKWSQETIDQRLKNNPYLFYITKNGKVRYKNYQDESNGKNITNLWDDVPNISSNSKESLKYDTQKPEELLERIIKMTTNETDVVADFFCGSGTTLSIAKKLNRNYIGCDINERAIEITNKRLIEVI